MSLHAWFTNDDVEVTPGTTLVLPLRIQNLEDTDETVAILPTGPASSWMSLPTHEITVASGSVKAIDIMVTPPELPTTNAGPTTVALRIIPQDERLDLAVETTIDVLAFDDRRIVALQPVQRARRRATYEFMVENQGNSMASCRLRLVDVTDRVDGSFTPPAVGVAPGESSLVQLRTKAAHGIFRRSTRTLDFEVEADQQGHTVARSSFALVQPPTISARLITALVILALALGAAAAAWYGVVQPEIQDAAASEVDRLIDQAAATPNSDQSAATGSTPAAEPSAEPSDTEPPDNSENGPSATDTVATDTSSTTTKPTEPVGVPDFIRLKVEAPLTQTADASFTIRKNQSFDLTDVRIENAFNDIGVATLLINGEEVFLWSLENIRGSHFEPSITQIRLKGGDNVTFSVRCDSISDPFRSTCTNAVNVGGLKYRR